MAPHGDPRLAYLRDLGITHGFTLEELETNRQGRIHPAQAKRGKSSGVRGWIIKPVDVSKLVQVAGMLISKAKVA